MKKTTKKLVLAKETVRTLGKADLTTVQGGSYYTVCGCASGAINCLYSQGTCRC